MVLTKYGKSIKNKQVSEMQIHAKNVVFDYGNTILLDPFEEIASNISGEVANLLRKNGYDVKEKEVVDNWVESNKTVNGPHYSHFSQEEPIIQDFLRRINVKPEDSNFLAPEILLIYRREFREFILRNDYTKTKETLGYLKNKDKKLFVWSNDREYGVKSVMKWMGLDSYFDKIISSEEIGVEKPGTEFFRKCLDMCDISVENSIYVGDDPGRDILPAGEVGLKTILYKTKEHKTTSWRRYNTQAKPDAVVKKISDLKEVIV